MGIVAGLLVVVAALVLLTRPGPDAVQAPDPEAGVPIDAPRPALQGTAPREDDGPAAAAATEAADAQATEPRPAVQDDDVAPGQRRIEGTLEVTTQDGRSTTDPDGELCVLAGDEHGGSEGLVAVTDGRWSLVIGHEDRVFPQHFQGSGGLFTFEGEAAHPTISADGRVALHARELPASWLRVVDAMTGADLSDVTVLCLPDDGDHEFLHPGAWSATSCLAWTAASPMKLPGIGEGFLLDRVPFHVGHADHEWMRVVVDMRTGGERLVPLRRAGSVDVRWTGAVPPASARLRIYPVEDPGNVLAEFALPPEQPLTVSGLPAGPFRIAIEVGPWWREPTVLGTEPVDVVAGIRAGVTLGLVPHEPATPVPLAGTLHLAEGWEFDMLHLGIERQEPSEDVLPRWRTLLPGQGLERVDGERDVWRFDAGHVVPGLYQLTVQEVQVRRSVRLGTDGERALRIEVPRPGLVSVRVVDVVTGEDAAADFVSWHGELPEGIQSYSSASVRADPGTKRFAIRAPQGVIHVGASGDYVQTEAREVAVGPYPREVVLPATLLGQLLLRLRDGTASRVWNWDWRAQLLGADGEDAVRGAGGDDDGGMLLIVAPGHYTLVLEPIEGYEPIPRREVAIEGGKDQVVVIDLVRAR